MGTVTKSSSLPPNLLEDAARARRRIGTVVHDDRGNASVKWRDAPVDYERPVLEVVREQGASPRCEEGCNPYDQRGDRTTPRQHPAAAPRPGRTDLRRLSEHIKKMRELAARRDQDENE